MSDKLDLRRGFGWQLMALAVLRQAWEDSRYVRVEPSDIEDTDGLRDFLQSEAGWIWWQIAGGDIFDTLERRLEVVELLGNNLTHDDIVMRLRPPERRAECAVDMPSAVQALLFTLREQED